MSLQLKNFTIVGIDGVGNSVETLKAIKYSCKNINFGKKLFLTSNPDFFKTSFCEIKKIDKMNYQEYNIFCLKHLSNFIDTEYIILVQSDGFIINYNLWLDEFMDYDYIGAPWPLNNIIRTSHETNLSYQCMIENNKEGRNFQVGNGGFSLRSKKLLDLCSKFYTKKYENYPEDFVISCLMRKQLEENGIKFPSVELAGKFSSEEDYVDNFHFPKEKCFGFHGKAQRPDLLTLPSLEEI